MKTREMCEAEHRRHDDVGPHDRLATALERFAGDPDQAATDLIEWYNVRPADLAGEDLARLAKLYRDGGFASRECANCPERVLIGTPDNWDHFQGVQQADFVSYPGSAGLCDNCRMTSGIPYGGVCPECGHDLYGE